MKHFTITAAVLIISFLLSCNTESENEPKDNKQENTEQSTEANNQTSELKDPKTVLVNEPTTVNIKDIETGAQFFGLTVTEADIPSEKKFTFSIAEEFIIDGSAGQSEGGITFMSAEPTRSNASLQIGDMQKPFFMWTSFNNLDAFQAALSDEQKQKVNTMEGISVKAKLKNYKISADSEAMWISASADFVELITE